MRPLLAILTAVSLVALAAASASAGPTRTAKLTGPEQKWASPVIKIWNAMNAGLSVVGKQTTAGNGTALIPGTKENKALAETLTAFGLCPQVMGKVKPPPSARLKPFATTMKVACAHLVSGANGVVNGISSIYKKKDGKLGALQIEAAFKEFKKGSNGLATARKQLLAVGGKSAFVA